ncbi:hypothetical protein QUF72_21245, partial [Desulfobacterales bacterium HSG2]|nr:hypothetical protein [Desulfobacterales bacterium HSG2]
PRVLESQGGGDLQHRRDRPGGNAGGGCEIPVGHGRSGETLRTGLQIPSGMVKPDHVFIAKPEGICNPVPAETLRTGLQIPSGMVKPPSRTGFAKPSRRGFAIPFRRNTADGIANPVRHGQAGQVQAMFSFWLHSILKGF